MALKSPAISPPPNPGSRQEAGEYLQLLGPVVERMPERIEVDVDETKGRGRVGWGEDVHGERTPPVLAGEFNTGDGNKHALLSFLDPRHPTLLLLLLFFLWGLEGDSKTLTGQQRHVRERYALERRFVLRVRHQEGFAHFRVGQDGGVDVGRDFSEKENVRASGFLEDIIEE